VIAAIERWLPEAAVIENVPEFLKWKLFPAWCAALVALGYAVSPHLLDAADFGVPQHRKRVFVILTKSKHPLELRFPRRDLVPASSFIDFNAGQWSPIEQRTARQPPWPASRPGARRSAISSLLPTSAMALA
jgi:DNA (cytosine-5)-methyltransferase 1